MSIEQRGRTEPQNLNEQFEDLRERLKLAWRDAEAFARAGGRVPSGLIGRIARLENEVEVARWLRWRVGGGSCK